MQVTQSQLKELKAHQPRHVWKRFSFLTVRAPQKKSSPFCTSLHCGTAATILGQEKRHHSHTKDTAARITNTWVCEALPELNCPTLEPLNLQTSCYMRKYISYHVSLSTWSLMKLKASWNHNHFCRWSSHSFGGTLGHEPTSQPSFPQHSRRTPP